MRLVSPFLAPCAILLLMPAVAGGQADSGWSVPVAPLTRVPSSTWGAKVIVIDSAEIASSNAPTFSELLQARRPGVRVFRSSGDVTSGALVLLRGPTSLIAPADPIVIVDGVRVDSRQYDLNLSGMVVPSRVDDLLPEDIQQIVMLSGPAAALYGDGAANGVIVVTTKTGGRGSLRLSSRATWDVRQTRDDFPANYRRIGVSPSTGQPVADCSLVAVENGLCTPTGLDVWNPLEQASPFHLGNTARGHLELDGTTSGTGISGGVTDDERRGTLPHDEGSRLGMRGKLTRALPWKFDISANGSYLRDNVRFGADVLQGGLLGAAQSDTNHGYRPPQPASDSVVPSQLLRHATAGIRLVWQPLRWLDAAVMTGRDRVTEHGRLDSFAPLPASALDDARTYEAHDLRTSGARVRASFDVHQDMAASTAIGYDRNQLRTSVIDSMIYSGHLGGLSASTFQLRTTSLWIDQQVALTRSLAIAVAAERITSSMFGNGAGREWFPSANISWATPLGGRGVSDLRLHAAYAEAAGASASLPTLAILLVPPFLGPPPNPKMERTKQLELGASATFGGSATLDLTAFDSRSTHLWESNSILPNGIDLAQHAVMTTRGLEAQLAAPILDGSRLRWNASLSMALLHNEVTHLGGTPQYFVQGSIVQGKPYGGVWATPYTYADANHDGIIGTNEVQLGSYSYVGAPLPTLEAALATDLRLPAHVVLSGRLDYRAGYKMLNFTESDRCVQRTCRGAQDPSAPLDEQAAATSLRLNGLPSAYARDASFLRLREVALRWPIPPTIAGRLGAELSLAGRNLATWTRYPGLDPEITAGSPSALPRVDEFRLPLPREFIVRLDVGAPTRR